MTILQSIILGIIQGLTEFLPISSSAHLVVIPYLLGWEIPVQEAFIFDILVQVASLVAVIAYFWTDLIAIVTRLADRLDPKKTIRRFSCPARLAFDPGNHTGWFGWPADQRPGRTGFRQPGRHCCVHVRHRGDVNSCRIFQPPKREAEQLNWKDALWIGLAQAVAIFPGISRSGATISGGMARGLKRPAAARFAFLMSIPIMLAAGLLASLDMVKISGVMSMLPVFIPGLVASAIVSYFAIRWLLKYLTQRSLYIFALYCASLGSIVLLFSLFR